MYSVQNINKDTQEVPQSKPPKLHVSQKEKD